MVQPSDQPHRTHLSLNIHDSGRGTSTIEITKDGRSAVRETINLKKEAWQILEDVAVHVDEAIRSGIVAAEDKDRLLGEFRDSYVRLVGFVNHPKT